MPVDRKASRTVGAVTDTDGYQGSTEVAFETGSSGTRSLLDVDGSRLAVKNGGTVAWVIFDLHGSVAGLRSGTSISDAYRYDGWGQTLAAYPAGSGTANPWRYRGLLGVAPGTNTDLLYDMTARDYAPHLGTFTQWDSVQGGAANPLSMNRYLYALANPATLIDPDGHYAREDNFASTYAMRFTFRLPDLAGPVQTAALTVKDIVAGALGVSAGAYAIHSVYGSGRAADAWSPSTRPPDALDRRVAEKPRVDPPYGTQRRPLLDNPGVREVGDNFVDQLTPPEPGDGRFPGFRPPSWCGETCRTVAKFIPLVPLGWLFKEVASPFFPFGPNGPKRPELRPAPTPNSGASASSAAPRASTYTDSKLEQLEAV